jgi:hypothetical protein
MNENWIAFVSCEGFRSVPTGHIIGFFQGHGVWDLKSSHIGHGLQRPFVIIRCDSLDQYQRVVAACNASPFTAYGDMHPIHVRRFVEKPVTSHA